MVVRFTADAWDAKRQKLAAGSVVQLVRLLAPGIWEARVGEFDTVILAESVMDKNAEVVSRG